MAYDIHITKRNNWLNKGEDITSVEWEKLIDEDSELGHAEKIEGETKSGAKFEYTLRDSRLAKWKHPISGQIVWLVYTNGEIRISRPDETIIEKAKQIAKRISAKVQGDELETY